VHVTVRYPAALHRGQSLEELEAIYAGEGLREVPRGVFAGEVLARLDNRGARSLVNRAIQVPQFEWTPFGIDFDDRRWYFVRPSLRIGRFDARPARSRWRDTDTIALEYDASRLPRAIKALLYDEVKPLGEDLLLGLGGIARERGEGDHFFFALRRVRG
jgi:hypothetical protein